MAEEDVEAVRALERLAFPDIPEDRYWRGDQLRGHLRAFSEGQFVAETEGKLLGSCTNMRTRWEAAMRPHTWHGITGDGTLSTHDPRGDVLYGTEVMVHPEARRTGIGRRLFEQRFALVRALGLRAFVTGGRLPGYGKCAAEMTAWGYVKSVARGELTDPVLTPEIRWGLTPRDVLCGYMIDPSSLHHAVLAVWENPAVG